jgi:hypothetical protein
VSYVNNVFPSTKVFRFFVCLILAATGAFFLYAVITAKEPDPRDKPTSICVHAYIACTQTQSIDCISALDTCMDIVSNTYKSGEN